jgi:hypothetical protein
MEGGLFGVGLLLSALVGCFSWLRKKARLGDRYMTFAFCFFGISIAENIVENIFGRSTDFLFVAFLMLMLSSNAVFSPTVAAPASPRREAVSLNPASGRSLHV